MFMNRRLQKVILFLWATMIILLPITSMPFVVKLVRSDTVAAPAGIILLLLVILWLLPSIYRGIRLPVHIIPLLTFLMAAIISTAASVFINIPPFKEIDFFRHVIQAVITLGIGVCFYFIASTFPADRSYLVKTIKWINWSGMLVLIWSLIQASAWHYLNLYPVWMETVQRFLSTGVLYKARVSGFALEPSWLAHQLNMLYLPLWLACTVKQWSAHRFKIWIFTLENCLLIGGVIVMWLTLSRVGMIAIVFMMCYLIIRAALRLSIHLQNKLTATGKHNRSFFQFKSARIFINIGLIILLFLFFLFLLAVIAYGFSKFDPRMNEVFHFEVYEDNTILRYANRLDFGPRMVYWFAGWDIFNDYPWMGVGLGNAGYFFPEKIIPYGWNFMEVSEMMYRSPNLTNIKSLWVRLLAETGIIGFSLFISWLFTLWRSSCKLVKYDDQCIASLGFAGIFVIIGLVVEGFSVDSFALPYFWITLGLATCAYSIGMQESRYLSSP